MNIRTDSELPLFVQIAEGIEDAILLGAYPEETQVPSTTEISQRLNVNPATALKGINLLVHDGIIYKKRGVGMFVSAGAAKKLRTKRKDSFFEEYIVRLAEEAKRLNFTLEETIELITRGFGDNGD